MSDNKCKTNNCQTRLGNCEVCAQQASRYACPKCEVKTCSLPCVQIHKRELGCDGIRDRTKYMPLSAMTEREFMSDYCFLEECTRYAEDRKKDQSKRYTHQQRQLPVPMHRMRLEAQKRGIRLQLLLPHFTRRKQNSTFLNWKLKRFFWQIEWLFVHADSEPTTLIDSRCDEDKTIAELLQKYLDLQAGESALQQRKVLQHHRSAGLGQLTLWLRAEGVRCSGSRCYALAAHKTLRQNLAGKTIVEFPTIYVSYEQRPPSGYEIVDSDEEAEAITTKSAEVCNKRQKTTKSEMSQKQPKAKKSKSSPATMPKKLIELHNIFDLAASFNAAEDEHDEGIDNEDYNESETNSEDHLSTFVY